MQPQRVPPASKSARAPLTGHARNVNSVAFSPDGGTLASGSSDKTIRLWDVRTRRRLGPPLTGHTDAVRSVAFSRDGRTLASGGDDRTIRPWDIRTRKPRGAPLIAVPNTHNELIPTISFGPDGRSLAIARGTIIELWDMRVRKRVGTLRGHTSCRRHGVQSRRAHTRIRRR